MLDCVSDYWRGQAGRSSRCTGLRAGRLWASGSRLCDGLHQRSLPLGKRRIEIYVAVHPGAEAVGSERLQLLVQVAAKLAEVFVAAISKRQNRVRKILEAGKVLNAELVVKRLHRIWRIAFAICARDQHGITFSGQ